MTVCSEYVNEICFSYNIGNLLTNSGNDEHLFINFFGYIFSCVSKLHKAERPNYLKAKSRSAS